MEDMAGTEDMVDMVDMADMEIWFTTGLAILSGGSALKSR
jgi:hypothetical protein